MKLGELMEKPLSEALKELELVEATPHANGDGTICSLELKYIDPTINSCKLSQSEQKAAKKKYYI